MAKTELGVMAVTGGARGIGLAIAKAAAEAGARVAIGDVDDALAREAAGALRGGPHRAYRLDVRDRASFEAFVRAAEADLGPLDVLVNNAGIMPSGPFLDESDALSDTQIDVNLRGVVHGCKAALPGMLSRGRGHVVNVASMAGRFAVPGLAVYCASKFGVVGLTEALREEYRDSGVSFTMVLPAKVRTELASGTDRAAQGIPTASPVDVADGVMEALRTRAREVAVPRYIGAIPPLQAVAPYGLLTAIRRLIDDRRVLEQMDRGARARYDARLDALANTPRGGAREAR